MSEKIEAINSAEDLLNANLDDLADMDGFGPPPDGAYKLSLSIQQKKISDAHAVEFNYSVLEALELADPTAEMPKVGKKFSEAYRLNNEFGVGAMKAAIKPIAAGLGLSNLGEIIEQAQGLEVFATVGHRVDKNDATKSYARVSNITLG